MIKLLKEYKFILLWIYFLKIFYNIEGVLCVLISIMCDLNGIMFFLWCVYILYENMKYKIFRIYLLGNNKLKLD